MNTYNFIRPVNGFYCTNQLFGNKANYLKDSFLQYVNFIHTSSLVNKRNSYDTKSILLLSSNKYTRRQNQNIPIQYLNFNIIPNNYMYHTLTNIPDNVINKLGAATSFSTDSSNPPELTRAEKLKRAVKEYGSTVIIFHVTISLMSLGVCYLVVSSGIDVAHMLSWLGITGMAANAGTFVTAYAIHKVFAPVRISLTLGVTPFIVRYLRRIGFLKVPKA